MPKPLIQSTGRRKEAVARVRLRPGSGVIIGQRSPVRAVLPDPHAPGGRARAAAPHADRRRVRRRRHARRRWRERTGRRAPPRHRPRAHRARRGGAPAAQEGRDSSRATPARRNGASTASRRPVRRRSTRSAEAHEGFAMTLRFGTDGVRGVANRELTPELVTALGRAAARVLGTDQPFVVGRDTRRSGPMIEAALVAGLCAEGADVVLVGRAAHARRRPRRPGTRRARGGDLGEPQPVRRQRGQAVRARRSQDPRAARASRWSRSSGALAVSQPEPGPEGVGVGRVERAPHRARRLRGHARRLAAGSPAHRAARRGRLRQRCRVPRRAHRACARSVRPST